MQPSSSLPIAIVGAGIGGLAAAISLRRAGWRVMVFEQAPALRELGAAIGLRPATVKVLRGWGLGDALAACTARVGTIKLLDGASGQPIGELMIPSETSDPTETWSDIVHRGDLHGLLASQVPEEIVHVSHKCQSVIDHGDHVELRFANGEPAMAAAVIAADGIHSAIRPMMSQDNARYSGMQGHRGILPVESVQDILPNHLPCSWWMEGGMGPPSVFVLLPVRGGRFVGFDAVLPDPQASDESWRSTVSREQLIAKLQGFPPQVAEFVRRLDATEVSVFSLYDRDPIPRWTDGRVTLLGDAAHPMLPAEGQGANQAIQDAVVLGECLLGVDGAGLPAALRRYSDLRMPITAEIQRRSRMKQPFKLVNQPA